MTDWEVDNREYPKCSCMLFANYSTVKPSYHPEHGYTYCICGAFPEKLDGPTAFENLAHRQ